MAWPANEEKALPAPIGRSGSSCSQAGWTSAGEQQKAQPSSLSGTRPLSQGRATSSEQKSTAAASLGGPSALGGQQSCRRNTTRPASEQKALSSPAGTLSQSVWPTSEPKALPSGLLGSLSDEAADSAITRKRSSGVSSPSQPEQHMLDNGRGICRMASMEVSEGTQTKASSQPVIDNTVDEMTRHLMHAREKIDAVETEFAQIMSELVSYGQRIPHAPGSGVRAASAPGFPPPRAKDMQAAASRGSGPRGGPPEMFLIGTPIAASMGASGSDSGVASPIKQMEPLLGSGGDRGFDWGAPRGRGGVRR